MAEAGDADAFEHAGYQISIIVSPKDCSRCHVKEVTEFAEDVEWTWWEIWHHEGRVARHGASMMAPDYTHWHGLYKVAKHWCAKFIPELEEIAEKSLHFEDPAIVAGREELAPRSRSTWPGSSTPGPRANSAPRSGRSARRPRRSSNAARARTDIQLSS